MDKNKPQAERTFIQLKLAKFVDVEVKLKETHYFQFSFEFSAHRIGESPDTAFGFVG